MKTLIVIGTRPEAIKMAPLILELRRRNLDHVVCLTGQHRELVDQVMSVFGLTADIDLNLMQPGQSLIGVAARVLTEMEAIIEATNPDWVAVQGDTTTVAAAALAGALMKVRVAHVEAGLRSGDKSQPFPEEINRIVAGHVADLHLAPTRTAAAALHREGIAGSHIVVTGNTVIDALSHLLKNPVSLSPGSVLHRLDPSKKLVVLTAHRRENFGAPIREALGAIADLANERYDEIQIVYPVHPNPNVSTVAKELLGGLGNVELCAPVDYFEMVELLNRAHLAITDSGGVQEEAPALATPVLVLREVTERPEAVASGAAILVGTNGDLIAAHIRRLLDNPLAHAEMATSTSPYGDGHAARRAVAALLGEAVDEFCPESGQR